MALLLSLETATPHCAVALSDGPRVLVWREEGHGRPAHAERLNVFIDEVLREAGIGPRDLAAVAVGIGPGSYTGLRIGLSAAKGLCYALEIPIIGMGTLEVLAHALLAGGHLPEGSRRLMPMVDARRMEVFTLMADMTGKPLVTAHPAVLDAAWTQALPADGITIVFGDGADKAAGLWAANANVRHEAGIRPSHAGMARLAHHLYEAGTFSDLAYLVPDYGKAANVTQPGKARG